MDFVTGLLIGLILLLPAITIYGLIDQWAWGVRNNKDMRSAGQCQLDGIPRQETRTRYIVEYYRKYGHVDKQTVEALHDYMVTCRARVDYGTPDIDDEIEYQRAQEDFQNARKYYIRFGG